MEKIEVGKKNFEEFINEIGGVDKVEMALERTAMLASLMAASIATMVKDEHQEKALELITEFEECSESLGVVKFISQMLNGEGDSDE